VSEQIHCNGRCLCGFIGSASGSSAQGYAIDELKEEITRFSGRIEDLERSQKDHSGGGAEVLHKLDSRIQQLEQNQATLFDSLKKPWDSLIQGGDGSIQMPRGGNPHAFSLPRALPQKSVLDYSFSGRVGPLILCASGDCSCQRLER
jgi:hypothetical protein